jgi:hypothetical protein
MKEMHKTFQVTETDNLQNEEGEKRRRRLLIGIRVNVSIIFAVILLLMLLIFAFPFSTQTQIKVTTQLDDITNVSVETPSIPLVSRLFPPSYGKGAYTIGVIVYESSIVVLNETIEDVPSGEYNFVWVDNGIPEKGTYNIMIHLYRASSEVDAYPLSIEF